MHVNKQVDLIYKQLKKLVSLDYPVGLIASGAPDDEYDTYFWPIIKIILRNDEPKYIEAALVKELDLSEQDTDNVRLIARNIIDYYLSLKIKGN